MPSQIWDNKPSKAAMLQHGNIPFAMLSFAENEPNIWAKMKGHSWFYSTGSRMIMSADYEINHFFQS